LAELWRGPVLRRGDLPECAVPERDASCREAEDQKSLEIGATYDLKVVKLHALYAKEDNVSAIVPLSMTGINGRGSDANAWMVGLHVPLGANASKILASYQQRDGDRVNLSPTTYFEADLKVFAIGYEYWLSRRHDPCERRIRQRFEVIDTSVLPAYPGSGTHRWTTSTASNTRWQ
jgi:hypothetical protein